MTFNETDGLYIDRYDLTTEAFLLWEREAVWIHLVRLAIETSANHDRYLQSRIDYPLVNGHQVWVLTQYAIQLYHLPEADAILTVTTRISEANRFFVTRYFTVEAQGQLLMEIYAQFAVIDYQERNLVRLDIQPLQSLNLIDGERAYRFAKIRKFNQVSRRLHAHLTVESKAIDSNAHVNNLVYLTWCVDLISSQGVKTSPAEIHIKYGKELRLGDLVTLVMECQSEDNRTTALFTIINEQSQTEACLIKMTWTHLRPVEKEKLYDNL